MAKDSIPELELANVRTRERLTDSVSEIRRRSDVPARTRLAVAKARQRWHRDPTPLVAMAVTAATGIAAIVLGTRIGRTDAGHLDEPAASTAFTALLPFGARGAVDPDQAKGGRTARKARRKAAEEALERDPAHKNRVKQRVGIVAVQRRANKNRKQAAKRSKAAAKAALKAKG
ncbi:hypothetical protein [Curtobacterium sp. MCSS17_007]|uniref:hypothetical protein n=1 Tax=Curtobacterium sp. MCSS17_007 TaxID=2175646 RepID=UPI000DA8984D|nr:hypothetical protein [Curtobacterium sp. MCSS17_007]WIE76047.1 hypothetical protein DEJ22_001920 [Curtobacterium sp. MCSS17_007]